MRIPYCIAIAWLLILTTADIATRAEEWLPSSIRLTDVTRHTGISFRHTHGGSGQRYIVEFMASGLALFDFDGDGWVDIYFLNGAPLPGTTVNVAPRNALYRNNGDWTFTDVTQQAGVGDHGFGLGVTVGDYDNDGDQDIYVNNFGPNVLYRNHGDGTFSDASRAGGVVCGDQVAGGTCFLDADGDGNLDLYVGNYVDFTYESDPQLTEKRRRFFSGPEDYEPLPDQLLRNNGDGTFTDVSAWSGIHRVAGSTMGMICFDYDADADTDIFVCNDAMQNFLFENDGKGQFAEKSLLAGLAFNYMGIGNGSMGVDCADYDNDGLLDLVMTDYMGELPVLYRNVGHGLFEDRTALAGVGGRALPEMTWGTGLVDFDNDGDRDIFMACGHFFEDVGRLDDRASYRAPNLLLMNTGKGKYVDVTSHGGSGMAVVECSRGAAFDDLDNDGDVDAVVLNSNALPTILRNDSPVANDFLEIRVQGCRSNRDGVGAQVKVVSGELTQVAEVHSGRGYQSHFSTQLHFGLGRCSRVDRVEVRWLGGGKEAFHHVPTHQRVVLIQGRGRPVR